MTFTLYLETLSRSLFKILVRSQAAGIEDPHFPDRMALSR